MTQKTILFDLEGDGLEPTKIHCFCWTEKEDDGSWSNVYSTTDYSVMRSVLSNSRRLIGHNIQLFDVPVLERLLQIKIKCSIVDTLGLSWYLYPKRPKHGLADWGVEFGTPKPVVEDWENQPIEVYLHRCTEDVKNNLNVWKKQEDLLHRIYENAGSVDHLIEYISFKLYCVKLMQESKWKLDIEAAKKLHNSLQGTVREKTLALQEVMPPRKIYKEVMRPKKCYTKDGSLSKIGERWDELTKKVKKPFTFPGPIRVWVKNEPPNPGSPDQVKAWLTKLGWKPTSFKFVRDNKTFKERAIPQVRVDGEGGKQLCPSVVKLIERNPGVGILEGLTVAQHRLSIVKEWLETVEDGYIYQSLHGFTNTMRLKHKNIVNVPGAFKAYGQEIRGCLVCEDDEELCGSDMSSLEDRTKQHYIWDYDPDYVREMQKPDFDPHLDLAYSSSAMTLNEVEAYKNGDHSLKHIRHAYKTGNYACTYGAQPPKISRELDIPLAEATKIVDGYWDRNWSVKKVAENATVVEFENQKWIWNPVAQIWYSLKKDKDRFSTLNQGTGAYCFDMWIKNILSKRPQLTAQFHDEGIWCIKKGHREDMCNILEWAIKEVNKQLNLNRELEIDIQFGNRYSEIH